MTFYGETLGMPRSATRTANYAEFETGAVRPRSSVIDTDAFKFDFHAN